MNAAASAGFPWLRRLRNAFLAAIALVAIFAILGFFAVPPFAKAKLESFAAAELGRSATAGKVEFNPFTLRARVADFALADREPGRTLFAFEALEADLSMASVWNLAPVFDAIRIVRPRLDLVRNADATYNVSDLIERAQAREPGPPPPFSLNNIEIDDGTLKFDDRRHGRTTTVTSLDIGIPFLSSLPHDAEIRVTPRLAGAVDGARFALEGTSTTPFADVQEATLELNLDALSLPRYAGYVPLPQGLKLVDGALTTRLTLRFVTEKGAPRAIALAGTARIDRLAIARRDDSPLAGAKSVEIALARLDPLARSIGLERIAIEAPEADLRRFADGTLEIVRLIAAPRRERGDEGAGASAPRWTFAIASAQLANGVLRVADEAVAPAFRVALSNVSLDATDIASAGAAGFDIAFDSESGAHFGAKGTLDLAGSAARGNFALTKFRLAELYPYYASALNLDVRRGLIDLAGEFAVDAAAAPVQLTLAHGAATLSDVEMALRGEREPHWSVPRAELKGIAFDLAQRSIAIDDTVATRASIRVVRLPDGTVEFERIVRASPAAAAPADAAPDAAADAGWKLSMRRLVVEPITAEFEDRAPRPPVKLRIADARVAFDDLSNVRGAKGAVDFAARIGRSGRLRFAGALATRPLAVDWRVDAAGLDLVPLRPYFEARTNVIVTGGAVSAKGRVTYAEAGAGRAAFAGDVSIADFGSLDRPTSQELLRWKSLRLTGVDAASSPPKLALGAVALDRFYARLIVDPDATLNLQRLLAPESAGGAGTVAAGAPGASTKELRAPAGGDKDLPVSIGRIQVSNGEVEFSDFFIRPNYSAHLTEVAGSVSALSATQAGEVELAARIENTAPAEIRGTLNPFARELSLDLTGKARDVDLPPLTPYSAKYAGYGIEKGKLSFEVRYRIENRKLAASNRLTLDQLTFGARVESPTATKLPVLLAVALLKDRNGVINLDLPIEGTLDDPKFSVWGVIVQIVVNLITKIVTAPFAVLGALAGGGGEQLAYVEFAPGRADLSPAAVAKLGSLAKALAERPALKLDATGRAVPDVDRDGLKRVALDRAMRVQKQKDLVAEGASAPALDTLAIDAAEYPKYLARVYRDADLPDKPRNVLGMAKDIPAAEMEALLLASYRADDEALRSLANRRALAVKDWFAGPGGIASERVFVVAAKLGGEGITDKGAATRVDFAIR